MSQSPHGAVVHSPDHRGICVVGSFMMDLIAYAPSRPKPGETQIGTEFIKAPGGKGFNQAVASARGGAATSMVGRVGRDMFGDEFVQHLKAEGVNPGSIGRDAEIGTGVGLPVVSADGQNSIIVIPRANHALTPEHIRTYQNTITSCQVLLLQLELPLDATIEAACLAHKAGVCVVLNPAPFTHIPDELLACCDLIVPNEVELTAWTGLESSTAALEAATQIARDHDIDLVVTLGARGVAVIPRSGEPQYVPAHNVEVVDTIGAGDTFCGYLCALLCEGADLPTAARFANAAAAIAVTRSGGASSPTRREVEDFLSSNLSRKEF